MGVPVWVDIVDKLVTPAIAAISAAYAYLQYRRAKRWKASDLAIHLVGELDRDPALALACQALDWGVGPLLVPERYQAFFHVDIAGALPNTMDHDPAVLARALEPKLNRETLQDPKGLVYRHCFIRLFEHFDNINRLLDQGQLVESDLRALTYWLRHLRNYPYAPKGSDPGTIFFPALEDWHFQGVIRLADRLGA